MITVHTSVTFLALNLVELHYSMYVLYLLVLGEAYRRCLPDGVWDLLINIAQCRHLVFTYLLERVNELLHSPSSVVDALNQLQGISGELVHVSSIEVFFPNDLNTTIGIIDTITRLL